MVICKIISQIINTTLYNNKKMNSKKLINSGFETKNGILAEHCVAMSYLSSIAGFFHDIGKANDLFQNKLVNKSPRLSSEPLRHEWVSMRLFQAFVGEKDDRQWLLALTKNSTDLESIVLKSLPNYQDLLQNNIPSAFSSLSPLASLTAWLIVSHHRLPQFHSELDNPPSLSLTEKWRDIFEPCWNSPQSVLHSWSNTEKKGNWTFSLGTPFVSVAWKSHLAVVARQALACDELFVEQFQENILTGHLARLALMLADHAESSRENMDNLNSDISYLAYSNTTVDDQGARCVKQKLDQHNVNVGELANKIARDLPFLKSRLTSLGRVEALEKDVPDALVNEFGWQDKSSKLALSIRDTVKSHGFFGICMASTGKGKTRANAKIMYALSDEGDCRFSVALGLRTLTVQTANALKKDLDLTDKDVSLLIGSQAVKDLHQLSTSRDSIDSVDALNGSESIQALLGDDVALLDDFETESLDEIDWISHDPKILRLLNAPVLVSTIDYLMPATEGVRGGRQIAPMLRLLTSDLVLDEPDEFSLDDLPALCRLVNWAGMMGSKVLLSSATISPTFASSLFDAYRAGRKHFTQASSLAHTDEICCAWFDECTEPRTHLVDSDEKYDEQHASFVKNRVDELSCSSIALRQGKLVDFPSSRSTPSELFSQRIYQSLCQLHDQHAVELVGKRISIGLVRMANINPLVAVAKHLLSMNAPDNTHIHYCLYHSQFPLLQRSGIERRLDKALTRGDHELWVKNSGLTEIVNKSATKNHIFVVIATSVAEVGRDHDYDWAIVEPSSQRSIIQLAGRVQRHRKLVPTFENMHILAKNFIGMSRGVLNPEEPCFVMPGFESKRLRYASNDLRDLHLADELRDICATPRVLPHAIPLKLTAALRFSKFSELEHIAQGLRLRGNDRISDCAHLWWNRDVSWYSEVQRNQPFRRSAPTDDYCFLLNRNNKFVWQKRVQENNSSSFEKTVDIISSKYPLETGDGIFFWGSFDLEKEVGDLASSLGDDVQDILPIYTHVGLRALNVDTVQRWNYQVHLGLYKNLKEVKSEHD
jgi:CRISPR-associated endonuclease/helicase Cas3